MAVHPKHTNLTRSIFLISSLLIAACSGGGGSGPSPTTSSGSPIRLEKSSIDLESLEDGNTRYTTRVRVDLSTEIKSQLSSGKRLYFVLSQTQEIATLSAEVFSNYGNLVIETHLLPKGSYQSKITVKGCYDSTCAQSFGSASLDFSFQVHEKLTFEQEKLEITNLLDEAQQATEVTLDFKTLTLTNDDWALDVDYGSDVTPWLTIDKRVENNLGIVSITGQELACGDYQAKLIVSYTTASDISGQVELPIEYTVSASQPLANSAFPVIQYTDNPLQFTLRGCHLDALNAESELLASLTNPVVTVRSTTEVEVTSAPAEEGHIVLAGTTTDEANVSLTVRPSNANKVQDLDLQASDSMEFKRSLYDRHNERFYFQNIDGWHGFYRENDAWAPISNFEFTQVVDMEIANDGLHLYILDADKLQIRNAIDFSLTHESELQGVRATPFTRVRALGSGELLLAQFSSGDLGRVYKYSLTTHEMKEMRIQQVEDLGFDTFAVSQDRSAALFPTKYFSSSDTSPAYYLYRTADESSSRVLYGTQDTDMYRMSLSQNGNRMVTVEPTKVFINDIPNARHTTLPRVLKVNEFGENAFFKDAKISKDGNSVFVLYMKASNNMLHIRKFDITDMHLGTAPVIAYGKDIVTYAGYYPQLQLNGSEDTAFIFDRSLVVLPLTED